MADAINQEQSESVPGSRAHFPASDEAFALSALVWILGEPRRADRLLALTGLDADALRAGLDNKAVLAAVLDFLCGHEADLVDCASSLGARPQQIVSARESLAGERIAR